MGTTVDPKVALVLHDATYVLRECRLDKSQVVGPPSVLEIIDGAYRRVGGEGEDSWPTAVPGYLATLREEPEEDALDELFMGRYRRWSDPRFPEADTEADADTDTPMTTQS